MSAFKFGLASLFVMLVAMPAFGAGVDMPNNHPHMWGGGWHGGFMGPFMMIAFLAIAVIVVVLVVRWLGVGGHRHAPPGDAPLDILKARFARGEIDKDEFEDRRRVLEG